MKAYLFLIISGLMTLSILLTAQESADSLNLPPPGASPVRNRVKIPMSASAKTLEEGDMEEVTEDDALAFSIAAEAQGWVPSDSTGILKPGMPIQVTVIVRGRIELEPQAQRINQSGNIGLPLIQIVRIGNMDLEDAEKLLTDEYSKFYREPLVNVEFAGAVDDPSLSPWGYVTLMGNVLSPGPIAMPPTRILTVSGAVKLAGGSDASAKKGSIRIYRPLPEEDSVEMIKVDLDVLGRQGAHSEDVRLQAGDVIYIPERIF